MRTAVWGLLIAVGLVLAAVAYNSKGSHVFAQRPPETDCLIALPVRAGPEAEYVALVDPIHRVMGVYQIEPSSGKVFLKSVRNVHWDLQMDEFNGTSPTPREIRDMLE